MSSKQTQDELSDQSADLVCPAAPVLPCHLRLLGRLCCSAKRPPTRAGPRKLLGCWRVRTGEVRGGASGDAGKAGKAGNANSLDESAPKFKPPSALNGSNCSQTQPHFAVVCKLTGHILGESPAISRLTLTRYVALYFFKHPRWSRGKRGI